MFPPSGGRDRLVTIQQRPTTDAVDASYTPVDGPWTELGKVWARKMELGGTERFHAQQLSAKYDTRWQIGYRSDMDPETIDVAKVRRLRYKTWVFDIVSATMMGRREGIQMETLSVPAPPEEA